MENLSNFHTTTLSSHLILNSETLTVFLTDKPKIPITHCEQKPEHLFSSLKCGEKPYFLVEGVSEPPQTPINQRSSRISQIFLRK